MNHNNNGDNNTNNATSLRNENNSQMFEKQLSFITLPYKGQQGQKVLKSFMTTLHRSLPNDIIKFEHKHDLVYYVKCPECQED